MIALGVLQDVEHEKAFYAKTAKYAVEPSIFWRRVFADHWFVSLMLPTPVCIVITHHCISTISLLRIEVQLQLPPCFKVISTVVIPFSTWSASIAALLQTAVVHGYVVESPSYLAPSRTADGSLLTTGGM